MQLRSLLPLWALVAIVASAYTPCEDCTDRATPHVLSNITLRLYVGNNVDRYVGVWVSDVWNLYDLLDARRPTVLYIFGWTESPESTSVKTIVQAYLTRRDHNVLIVDWSGIAAQEWNYASRSADGVGYTVAMSLNKLVVAGLDKTTMQIVGHSLGAQIAGFVGRYVYFTLPKITGLDPAGPSFNTFNDHLSFTDASFVEVIHTDPYYLGIDYSTATVDFWPNGRSGFQPGCGNDDFIAAYSCSHTRSWVYYAESILNETAFIAIPCDSWFSFETGRCSSSLDNQVVMGYATPTWTSGDYYLQTNSEYPFGKGTNGVTYTA